MNTLDLGMAEIHYSLSHRQITIKYPGGGFGLDVGAALQLARMLLHVTDVAGTVPALCSPSATEVSPTNSSARLDGPSLDLAWGLIANVSGGDWSKQSQEWQTAAAMWRDEYCKSCNRSASEVTPFNSSSVNAADARTDSPNVVSARALSGDQSKCGEPTCPYCHPPGGVAA